MSAVNRTTRQKSLQPYTPRFFDVEYASAPCVPASAFDCSYSPCIDPRYNHCDYPWDQRFLRLFRSQLGGPVTLQNLTANNFPVGARLPEWITCDVPNPIFRNDEIEATVQCPEGSVGDPVTVTIPQGFYIGDTQERANLNAQFVAVATAQNQLECEQEEIPVLFAGSDVGNPPVLRNVLSSLGDPSEAAPYTQKQILGTVNGEQVIFPIYTSGTGGSIPGWEAFGPQTLIEVDENGVQNRLTGQRILVRATETPIDPVFPFASPFNSIHNISPTIAAGAANTFSDFKGISTRDAFFNYYNVKGGDITVRWRWRGDVLEDTVSWQNFQPLQFGSGQSWTGPSGQVFSEARSVGDLNYTISVGIINNVGYDSVTQQYELQQSIRVRIASITDTNPATTAVFTGYLTTFQPSPGGNVVRFEEVGGKSYMQFLGAEPQPDSKLWVLETAPDIPGMPANSGILELEYDVDFWDYV